MLFVCLFLGIKASGFLFTGLAELLQAQQKKTDTAMTMTSTAAAEYLT